MFQPKIINLIAFKVVEQLYWPPFAMAIAGGVLLSTVVSFFFVPPAFALLTRYGRLPGAAAPAGQAGAIPASASAA